MPLEKGCLWKEASLWKKACGEEGGQGQAFGKRQGQAFGKRQGGGEREGQAFEKRQGGEREGQAFGKRQGGGGGGGRATTGCTEGLGLGLLGKEELAGWTSSGPALLSKTVLTVEGLEEQKDKLQKALEKAEKRLEERIPALRAPSLPKSLGSWGQGWGR